MRQDDRRRYDQRAVVLPRLTPRTYRRLAFVAIVALAFIVETGAAVRLSGSGLGCDNAVVACHQDTFLPQGAHATIEFANRAVTGLVSLAVVVAVLGSLARVPRRRDLTWLSLGLVAGVAAQAILGMVVVWSHLWPPLVQGHFVLSMALLANALVLHDRAGRPDGVPTAPVVPRSVLAPARWLVPAAAMAIVAGTVVTGSGPHPGSHEGQVVERLPLAFSTAARIHGIAVWCLLALVVVVAVRAHRERAPRHLQQRITVLLVVCVAQAAVGYVQYATDVPAVLVAVHIAGAVAVWLSTLSVVLALDAPIHVARREAAEAEPVRVGA